jgi:hypothetical protein
MTPSYQALIKRRSKENETTVRLLRWRMRLTIEQYLDGDTNETVQLEVPPLVRQESSVLIWEISYQEVKVVGTTPLTIALAYEPFMKGLTLIVLQDEIQLLLIALRLTGPSTVLLRLRTGELIHFLLEPEKEDETPPLVS